MFFESILHAHLRLARAGLSIPQHPVVLRNNNIIHAIHVAYMHNSLLTSRRLQELHFVGYICGKHVTETVSEMASSFALFKPALWNIKETDTGPTAVPNLSSHPRREVC